MLQHLPYYPANSAGINIDRDVCRLARLKLQLSRGERSALVLNGQRILARGNVVEAEADLVLGHDV